MRWFLQRITVEIPNLSNKSCEARLEELILLLKLGVLIVILRKNQVIDIHQRKRGLCATAANCTYSLDILYN